MSQRRSLSTLMVLGILGLSACSDSVLFDQVPPPPPGGPMGPMGPNGQQGPGGFSGSYGNGTGYYGNSGSNEGLISGGLYARTMELQLDPSSELREEEVFSILFTGQAPDPYKLQRSGGKIQMKALVREERTEAPGQSSDGRAFVRMRLSFVMNVDKDSSLMRDYVSGQQVVLSRVKNDGRWMDRMEGRVKASDGRGDELEIRASREAVGNRDLELSRPWRGEVFVVRNGKSLRLGSFSGILQELRE